MSAAAPEPKANMGQPVPRYEARAKVTGSARYPSDERVERPAFAFLATSAIAKGELTGLDEAQARAVPGVLEIFTHRNTGELKQTEYSPTGGGSSTSMQEFGPKIMHDGQIIAMIVAETFEAAREAAYKLKASYRSEEPSATFGAAGETVRDAGLVAGTVTRAKEWLQTGSAESAFRDAPVKIEADYGTPTQHHNPIELFTTTCVWNGDALTVYEPSQFVYGLKAALAERLDIKPDQIRIISHYVGGAFGSKAQMTPRTGLVALAARRLGRPVKLVATRDQGFVVSTYRAETRHHIRLGATREGKFLAYAHEGFEATSQPDAYSVKGTEETAHLYAFGAVKTNVSVVHLDRNTPGFMRSPPVVPYVYALESAIDELAVALAMDPVELRRINDSSTDSFGKPWSSRSLMTCYDEAAKAFGWADRKPEPGSMREGDWLIGWGCATAVYPTHVAASAARVRFGEDGTVLVQTAAHDIGTGAYTVIAQMAATELGVPYEKVRVELGDSTLPAAPVAGGSTTTASVCSAVLTACRSIKAKLWPEMRPNDAPATDVGPAFQKLGRGMIEEYAEFVPQDAGSGAMKKLYAGQPTLTGGSQGKSLMYALGAEFVEVRINARTREIRCPRAVGAFAAGRIMNTRTARSQLMGGLIWGISSALHEETEIDEKRARYINDNISEYLIPVNADVRDVEVILVSETDNAVNPAGIKGLGELGNVGTAAAITNAVFHATGKRIRNLPVRIEDLLGSA